MNGSVMPASLVLSVDTTVATCSSNTDFQSCVIIRQKFAHQLFDGAKRVGLSFQINIVEGWGQGAGARADESETGLKETSPGQGAVQTMLQTAPVMPAPQCGPRALGPALRRTRGRRWGRKRCIGSGRTSRVLFFKEAEPIE